MSAPQDTGSLELDAVLEEILFYSLEQARAKLDGGEEIVPFTVVTEGEQLFTEEHPGEDVVNCRLDAQATVKSASTFADHYAFCYDGFIVTDQGTLDAVIVECADRDMEKAHAIALLYKTAADGQIEYAEQPALLDQTDSFFDREAVEVAKAEEAARAEGDEAAARIAIDQALGTTTAGDTGSTTSTSTTADNPDADAPAVAGDTSTDDAE